MIPAKIFIDLNQTPAELRDGLEEIAKERPLLFEPSVEALVLAFEKKTEMEAERSLRLEPDGVTSATIRYGRPIDAFRALGIALGQALGEGRFSPVDESCHFTMVGMQVEASRNGVTTPANVKSLMRRCALMGINLFSLYTEDTYEVPGEPYFGYLRGRYTQEELRDFDATAAKLGVEMIANIQTLGHLSQILQWNAYLDVKDTDAVLLVGEEKTYALIEKMIDAATAPFRSKRLHVGLDEAWDLGTGEYKKRNGERRTFDIMTEHLERVVAICEARGLRPMMWGDMFFRMGSKTGAYYDLDADIPPDVVDAIPKGVDLIYWDYFHQTVEHYAAFIDRHLAMGKTPIAAPGCHTARQFWANTPRAGKCYVPFMTAARQKGVREAFMTTWGDDGMELDIYSALPILQGYADMAYRGDLDRSPANLLGSSGADWEAFSRAADIDAPPYAEHPETLCNASRFLLYDDPLIGLCQPLKEGCLFNEHYEALAADLERAIVDDDPMARRLRLPAQIARVLSIKADLRGKLVAAYRGDDKAGLKRLLDDEVRPMLDEIEKLWRLHREIWLETYKPFGLEVIENRYGGLIARVRSLIDRLEGYLDGRVASIPEFGAELLLPLAKACRERWLGWHSRAKTPSTIT